MDRGQARGARSYRELPPPPGLEAVVACLWRREPPAAQRVRIVPDACVDLIWMGGELTVVGADTTARMVALRASEAAFGIRLRTGAAGAVLGLPASELRDLQVPVADLWGAEAARMPDPSPFAALAAAIRRRRAEPDRLVRAAGALLGRPGARVSAVAAELGVSERQLHRRTLAAVGYGPKMLARVARLRRLAALDTDSMARRALEAGYASQSHMADEVRRLTGLTAVRFLEDAPRTAA